jgi:mitogen-activated protein kinase 7
MQRHTFTALNSTFIVDSEYQFVKELGQGAYGCVVAAKHRSGGSCAIKKITNINTKVCISRATSFFLGFVLIFSPSGF